MNDEERQECQDFWATFTTVPGQRALSLLCAMYDGDHLVGDDTHTTYFKLGARDVIRYILYKMEGAEHHGNDE